MPLDPDYYPTCVCGHELNEHDGVECAVEDCDCIHYEGDG